MSHHHLAKASMRKCWRKLWSDVSAVQCGSCQSSLFVFVTLEATVALVTVYFHTALQHYEKAHSP